MSKINEVFKYPTFTYRKFNFFCVNIMRKNVKNNHKKKLVKKPAFKKIKQFQLLAKLGFKYCSSGRAWAFDGRPHDPVPNKAC